MGKNNRGISMTLAMAVGLNVAGGVAGQSTPVPASPAQTLAVPGASNSTPSLTAVGRTVAAAWTATKEASTNLYLAISNDGGANFLRRRVSTTSTATQVRHGTAAARCVVWLERSPYSDGVGQTRYGTDATRRDVIRMSRSRMAAARLHPRDTRTIRNFRVRAGGIAHRRRRREGARCVARGRDAERKMEDARRTRAWRTKDSRRRTSITARSRLTPHQREPDRHRRVLLLQDGRRGSTARGAVYAAWRHIFREACAISRSRNQRMGASFGPLVRVSDDSGS